MGREWYQWGVKSSKNRVRGGDRSSSGAKPHPPPPLPPPQVVAAAAAASGCMNVVSQLFDFHHLQFCLHHPNHHPPSDSSPDNPSSIKGLEAPRNSLETEVVNTTDSLASVTGDDNLYNNIPMGIQINTARRDSNLLRPQSPTPKTGNANYFSFSEQENSNTPVNSSRRDTKLLRVQAPKPKTGEKQRSSDFTSEISISPAGPRTPTLVARLMGLDLLPEGYPSSSSCTPRSSTTPPHQSHRGSRKYSPRIGGNGGVYDFAGSFSEPPRASVGGRRSDADGYSYNNRRLSLQINKENRGAREDVVELSRHSCSEINTKRRDVSWKGLDEENMISRSPSFYAKQIMKQVKETVMKRRFGADITNKTGEGQSREQRKDAQAQLVSAKAKRPQNDVVRETPSPRLSPLDANEVVVAAKKEPPRHSLSPLSPIHEAKDRVVTTESVVIVQPEQRQATKKGNGGSRIANSSAKRPPRMNKKEEQFVRAGVATTRASQGSDKKCKTTPLSSELVHHGNVVPSLAPLKKLDPSIGAHRKAVQEQVSIGTPKNKAEPSKDNTAPYSQPPTPPSRSGASLAAATRAEFSYINQILKRAGINRDTPVSFTRWFSASHPLDPSLFHRTEAEKHPTGVVSTSTGAGFDELSPPCNRRLMFELVDELLAHIMRPQKAGRAQAWPHGWARVHGFQVMRMVWTRVKGFPRADCRILQDIDELVEMDLSGPGPGSGMGFVAGEEEEDDIVTEIEREIVEALVFETAAAVGGRWR